MLQAAWPALQSCASQRCFAAAAWHARPSLSLNCPPPPPAQPCAGDDLAGLGGSTDGSNRTLTLCPGSRSNLGPGVPHGFPPTVAAQVKAIACELPYRLGLPLSRLSSADIQHEVVRQGLVPPISRTTVWRWLDAAALRPWQHQSWIFPRDPDFAGKAQPILDLYQRIWEGVPLSENDFVISADEKTSVQARRRKQPTLPPAPQRALRLEHEYFREGAWTYLAAWDVPSRQAVRPLRGQVRHRPHRPPGR